MASSRGESKDLPSEQGAGTYTQAQEMEARMLLSNIVESTDDAILSKDLDGVITSWNRGAERIYGYTPAEVVGKHVSMLTPPERRDEIPHIMERLRRGERIEHYETIRMTKDGRRLIMSLTISPLINDDGVIVGASAIGRDITEKRRAEEALRISERLAAAGRLAATIAHEINNPLEAVTNLAYLISQSSNIPADIRQYVDLMTQELNRVTHIARQALAFYRDTSQAVEVDLQQQVELVLELYAPRLTSKNISIRKSFETNGIVHGYPGELRQVLSNLIINAVEATNVGGELEISISPSRMPLDPNVSAVVVRIADNGPGIDEKHRDRIFDPFYSTKGERGSGLGLWVSRGIISKHGGEILLNTSTDRVKHGTEFLILLPTLDDK